MKLKFFALLLVLAMLCTVLTSCEALKLVNNILGLFNGDENTNNFHFNFYYQQNFTHIYNSIAECNRSQEEIVKMLDR